MFARVVEFDVISDAALEFLLVVQSKALPMVKAQPECLDAFVLVSETRRHFALGLSLWQSKADAEKYHRDAYTDIEQMLRHVLERDPAVSTFQVLQSEQK